MQLRNLDFGVFIHELREQHRFSQKIVADKLGIDISMLSKIEHGERQAQGYMLKPLAELFNLNFKEIQIRFLNNRLKNEFGKEPYMKEALVEYLSNELS